MTEIDEDFKEARHPGELKLLLGCAVLGGGCFVGLALSPDGANPRSLGFLAGMAAAVLIYASGVSLLRRTGVFDSSVRWLIRWSGFAGLVVSGVSLLSIFFGGSDRPAGFSAGTVYAVLGLAVSIYAIYYGYYYRTNTALLEMLRPFGFTLADSGPFGRDGKYDARGVWKGAVMLVNVNQAGSYKGSEPSFFLEICCEIKNWSGRRFLLQPKGYLNRSLGLPLLMPLAVPPPGWEAFGVYGEPPEAAGEILTALGGVARDAAAPEGFSYLLLAKDRVTLGYSGAGHPSLSYVKRRMDLAAAAAGKTL